MTHFGHFILDAEQNIVFVGFIISSLLAFCLTWIVLNLALKFGFVANPSANRWHRRPTALMGGVAIFISFLITIFYFYPFWLDAHKLSNQALILLPFASKSPLLSLMLGATAIFVIGLVDDIFNLKPSIKLLGQILAAAYVVGSGIYIQIVPYTWLGMLITVVWIVGITNAINLLDNMDGLAAGTCVIAALTLGVFSFQINSISLAVFCFILVGSSSGFLAFNLNPAKIFMGDCGSLFLGFVLATMSVIGNMYHASNLFLVLAVPIFILIIPIFDTALVTILRKMNRRPISQGGKDHTSHRLVNMGLSERRAVWLLLMMSGLSGLTAIIATHYNATLILVTAPLFLLLLVSFGVFVAGADVYGIQNNTLISRKITRNMRTLARAVADGTIVVAGFSLSFLLKFDGFKSGEQVELFYSMLAFVFVIKFSLLVAFRLYRSSWQSTNYRHEPRRVFDF